MPIGTMKPKMTCSKVPESGLFSRDPCLVCLAWTQEADVVAITTLFFVLVMLAATQDIAVDGWALTLLTRKHIGCGANCSSSFMLLCAAEGVKAIWEHAVLVWTHLLLIEPGGCLGHYLLKWGCPLVLCADMPPRVKRLA